MSDGPTGFEMHRRTGRGEHYWTAWGPFNPVMPKFNPAGIDDMPPTAEPIEAYRERICPCGAIEQEDYQGKRRLREGSK